MRDEDLRTELSALRKRLRRIDDEMTFIRNESRRFKHMGFGRDYHQSQLRALEEERGLCVKRLSLVQRDMERRPAPSARPAPKAPPSTTRASASRRSVPGSKPSSGLKVSDMLVIPVAMIMLGIQALQPKKKTAPIRGAYTSREQIRIRPVPAVDMSLPD